MIYLYAICEPGIGVDAHGLDGVPVEAVEEGGLTALVSSRVPGGVAPTPDALAAHDRVVAAAMESGAVLPARFGTRVRDEVELRAILRTRASDLARGLRRVGGRVELGVRALWPKRAEPAPAGGREFMLAKARARAKARALAGDLHEALAGLAVDERSSVLPRPDTPVSAAYLVERSRVRAFERRAAALRTSRDDAELVLTGPWPPYSFSEDRDE
ncbi:MAG: GvpL/GvpF family gas vesicle protein [Thermoleophilaceae bacterium]